MDARTGKNSGIYDACASVRDDPLGKEMAAHSSIPVWRILWTEEPGGQQPMGVPNSQTGLKD